MRTRPASASYGRGAAERDSKGVAGRPEHRTDAVVLVSPTPRRAWRVVRALALARFPAPSVRMEQLHARSGHVADLRFRSECSALSTSSMERGRARSEYSAPALSRPDWAEERKIFEEVRIVNRRSHGRPSHRKQRAARVSCRGDTIVLVPVRQPGAKPAGLFPLSFDYQEKPSAGKIPAASSSAKAARESRSTSRIIDAPAADVTEGTARCADLGR